MRAVFDHKPVDLESILSMCTDDLSVADTEIQLPTDEILRLQHRSTDKRSPFKLHATKYIPGELAYTLKPGTQSKQENETSHPAPQGREFKDGECFLIRVFTKSSG